MSFQDVSTDYSSFANYAGVEGDEQAQHDIMEHLKAGHLRAFDSVDQLTSFLDDALPVLSKIGIITKERLGKVKKRIILDTKVSSSNSAVRNISACYCHAS